MLANYFLVALRNLRRNKVTAFINITGLAIGLASCMLILLYTKDELSYDGFHAQKHRLQRIVARVIDDKGAELFHTVKTSMVVGPAFKQAIPGVSDYTRLGNGNQVVRTGSQVFNQDLLYADANFFSLFSFPLVSGDVRTALAGPHSVVLSEDAAKRYFGNTPPTGHTLDIQVGGKFEPFLVTAVAKRCPQNSTIKFDMLLPMKLREIQEPDDSWLNFNLTTFLLLRPNADETAITGQMARVYEGKAANQLKEAREKYNFNGKAQYALQPLLQIHLSTQYDAQDELKDASSPAYSWVLTGIAGFIIGIACINFINLTMAASLKRSREIGIRKVIGGRRTQLTGQFLGESFLTCAIAFVLALLLASSVLPWFNDLVNKQLSLSYLLDTPLLLGFLALFLFTGFAAGFYPALVLSGFRPVQTLYNRFRVANRNVLSKTLVVIQFTLAALLIITTVFLHQQFDFLIHKDLGYNDKGLVVTTAGDDAGSQFPALFRAALLKDPSIRAIGLHNRGREGTAGKVDGKEIGFDFEHIDDQYVPALQLTMLAGRNFSAQFPSDTAGSALINETFAAQAGWKDPIGKTVGLTGQNRKLTIVGVIKDYHFRPLNEKIGPQLFVSQPSDAPSKFYIRIAATDVPATLNYIETTFKQLLPFYPVSYTFQADANRQAYAQQEKWKQVIGFAAVFTIFISCIGLFGLTAISTEQRIKEFGIRKVLGASVSGIVRLASGNFIRLVLLADCIAIPLAAWAVHKWLQNFAYHIEPRWWVYAAATLMTLAVAGLTVGLRALKTAAANPVSALRRD